LLLLIPEDNSKGCNKNRDEARQTQDGFGD